MSTEEMGVGMTQRQVDAYRRQRNETSPASLDPELAGPDPHQRTDQNARNYNAALEWIGGALLLAAILAILFGVVPV